MNLPSRDVQSRKELLNWSRGGNGLTNFDPDQLKFYIAAIKEFGDPDYYVEYHPMVRNLNKPTVCSLHYRKSQHNMYWDTSAFFDVLNRIRKECI